MVEKLAAEDPASVVLGWWRRVEMALAYYTISYHGKRMTSASQAEAHIAIDGRVGSDCINQLRSLRRVRNVVAHQSEPVSPKEAIDFASGALDVIWTLGESVPNELAIARGAGRFA